MTEGNLERELQRRDLHAIGLVVVRRGHRTTDTLWCEPNIDPTPLYASLAGSGAEPGAMLLVHADGVTAYVQAEWRGVSWFTAYVDGLTRDIHRRGLDGFLLAAGTSCVGARN